MTIVDLKERLLKGDITSYLWLLTVWMWADLLTKEKKNPDDLENILGEILTLSGTNVTCL